MWPQTPKYALPPCHALNLAWGEHRVAEFYSIGDFIILAGFYSRDIVVNIFGRVCKESLECVPGPLERVLYGVGEVLESADGYLLLGRVLRGAIALRQVGNHNLRGKPRKSDDSLTFDCMISTVQYM